VRSQIIRKAGTRAVGHVVSGVVIESPREIKWGHRQSTQSAAQPRSQPAFMPAAHGFCRDDSRVANELQRATCLVAPEQSLFVAGLPFQEPAVRWSKS